MIRNIIEWIAILWCVFFLSMFWINNSHASEFPAYSFMLTEWKAYQHVETSALADHADKYHDAEIQIRSKIHRINEYTGVYGGEYIGLTMDDDITVFFYAKTGVTALVSGDTILVDGTYHKFGKFGGQSHDYFITTHRLERLQ
jgi:hypothetical protein